MLNAQAALIAAAASMSRSDTSQEMTQQILIRASSLKRWLDEQDAADPGDADTERPRGVLW